MGFGVREVKAAAEDVAEFVVEGHGCCAEAEGAEPGAVESGGARREVAWRVNEEGQSARKGADAVEGVEAN